MQIARHSVTTSATPARIWGYWRDAASWPTWDHGLSTVSLDGPFEAGTEGWLKPRKGPKTRLKLITVREKQYFHDRTSVPFGSLDFFHTLEDEDGRTKITQQIEMTGPLTFLFSRVIGSGLKRDLPSVMNELVRKAEAGAVDDASEPR